MVQFYTYYGRRYERLLQSPGELDIYFRVSKESE